MADVGGGGMVVPVRVLVATADLGEGHNAAAAALVEAFRTAYPGCAIRMVETLGLTGRSVSAATRWSYVLGVGPFAWCYQVFFDAVWRHRWFADGITWWVGRRVGPGLEREFAAFGPDLVVSTFPMASAGFARLRRAGRLPVPALAVVPDFAPHPFWVRPDLDVHLVSHAVCLADVRAVSPHAAARVSAVPVLRRFMPPSGDDRAGGSTRDRDDLRVVATFGGLGLGRVTSLVRTALGADEGVRLVVVCGRNERLRRRVTRLDPGDGRLAVHGWVDDMPALLRDCDVVINNAGGASALEALACGRPAVLADPIAGHGRANAARMAEAGLAVVCAGPADLTAELRRLARDPAYRAARATAAVVYAADRDLARDVRRAAEPLLRPTATRGR